MDIMCGIVEVSKDQLTIQGRCSSFAWVIYIGGTDISVRARGGIRPIRGSSHPWWFIWILCINWFGTSVLVRIIKGIRATCYSTDRDSTVFITVSILFISSKIICFTLSCLVIFYTVLSGLVLLILKTIQKNIVVLRFDLWLLT